jgi:SAM-dependent methyltransferase
VSRLSLAGGWVARRARELADAPARRRAGRGADAMPIPPRRLRARTGAPGIEEFTEGGRRAATELLDALAVARMAPRAGLPEPGAVRSVLDFGCGAGRVLPSFRTLTPAAKLTGYDVDATAIAWAASHYDGLRFVRSGYEPPLPSAAASFDLVYSISVLSHLDEPGQIRWLSELERVLAPGGVALLSTHGPHALEGFRSGAASTRWCPPEAFVRPPLGEDEMYFVPYTRSFWNRGELPGIGSGYGLTFHGPEYIRETWAQWFEVVHIAPHALTGWQDVVVCRRR